MFGKDSNKRFEVIFKENNLSSGVKIIVDKETGIQYLFSWDGYAGGITPLLDRDGNPAVTSVNL